MLDHVDHPQDVYPPPPVVEAVEAARTGWEWFATYWMLCAPALIVLLVVVALARRRLRELRRREPWSLERATWAQSGWYPTGRVVRKWRPNRRGGIR